MNVKISFNQCVYIIKCMAFFKVKIVTLRFQLKVNNSKYLILSVLTTRDLITQFIFNFKNK